MANQEHLDILKQGVEVWNQWREEHPEIRPDLGKASLVYSRFNGIDFRRAVLDGASFEGSFLTDADLSEATLNNANLCRADLSGANLHKTSLVEANLSSAFLNEAKLHETNLSKAILAGAALRRADLYLATLKEADLSDAYLYQAKIVGVNLQRAIFTGVDLSGADLHTITIVHGGRSSPDRRTYPMDISNADLSWANLTGAKMHGVNLSNVNLSNANLTGADLRWANLRCSILVKTILKKADLSYSYIHGISVWDVDLEEAKQLSLVITERNEPAISVDNLEVAQFIYLLLNHKKLRDAFDAMTERGVLLLGRFGGGGLKVLQAIAAKLREANYLPIIFDFERPQDRNYTETVKTLAGLSRFVIADLSGPSVPQELYATVPHFKIPFIPIIETGRKPFSMAVDILEYPWVVRPPVTFATTEELIEKLPTKVIAPAEEKHQARQKLLDELFNKT